MLHAYLMAQEMTQVDFYLLAMTLQRSKVSILTKINVGVMNCWLNLRREILDLDDLVLRAEHQLKQACEVQPFPWCPSQLAVVEVETVDVDECAKTFFLQDLRPKKLGPPKRPCAWKPKPPGW